MTDLNAEAGRLTERFPHGTPVRYWTGDRDGPGRTGHVRSTFQVLAGHTVVVWVTGYPACVAASHVEPLPEGAP